MSDSVDLAIRTHCGLLNSRSPSMERFYAPTSAEAQSFHRVKNDHFWDSDHGSLTETLMGLCASYAALARFISGQDLYIPPRNRGELLNALKRYATDALHNLISHSRTALEPGGYSRACEISMTSLSSVLAVPEHITHLLELHQRPIDPSVAGGTIDEYSGWPITPPRCSLRT